jgi:hypothetical protein
MVRGPRCLTNPIKSLLTGLYASSVAFHCCVQQEVLGSVILPAAEIPFLQYGWRRLRLFITMPAYCASMVAWRYLWMCRAAPLIPFPLRPRLRHEHEIHTRPIVLWRCVEAPNWLSASADAGRPVLHWHSSRQPKRIFQCEGEMRADEGAPAQKLIRLHV